jgi:hypothetical protein
LNRPDLSPQTGHIWPDTEKGSEKPFRAASPSRFQLQKLLEPVRCCVCEHDVDEAAYIGGQWWCARHVEKAA